MKTYVIISLFLLISTSLFAYRTVGTKIMGDTVMTSNLDTVVKYSNLDRKVLVINPKVKTQEELNGFLAKVKKESILFWVVEYNRNNIFPEDFTGFVNLEALVLNNQSGIKELPSSVFGLTKLKLLDLKQISIKQGKPSAFAKTLEVLNLKYIAASDIDAFIYQFPKLNSLYINADSLDVLNNNIAKLSNLKELFLLNNNTDHFTKLPASIYKLKKLKKLNIHASNSFTVFPDRFMKMKFDELKFSTDGWNIDLAFQVKELKTRYGKAPHSVEMRPVHLTYIEHKDSVVGLWKTDNEKFFLVADDSTKTGNTQFLKIKSNNRSNGFSASKSDNVHYGWDVRFTLRKVGNVNYFGQVLFADTDWFVKHRYKYPFKIQLQFNRQTGQLLVINGKGEKAIFYRQKDEDYE